MLIKFKVYGNLRFLSHSETVEVFRRACVRAGINIQYTEGFNPHQRLSLPLPRSVGVESDDELLCLRMQGEPLDIEQFKAAFAEQLPVGIELLSVTISKTTVPLQPRAATYILDVQPEYSKEELKTRIAQLLASENLNLDRYIHADSGKFKIVDVRRFIKSIELDDTDKNLPTQTNIETATRIVVQCEISQAGSIRVEEIMKLLGVDTEKLAAPIKRTTVQWQ